MDLFPLPIFPQGALRESVVTTVWVGIFVISWFNLRLGWTYSGLVVPGYLVPLLLIKPLAAGVVLVEALLTYGLVWSLSEWFSKAGAWSNVFGRDRFFAILLASVALRLLLDGWALPAAADYLTSVYHLQFDFHGNLHSFGTVVVALIANSFWKSGLKRGLIPFGTTLGITMALVLYVLPTVTNFNLGGLEYMYEDFASSFLASPKAYIILLTVAFVASRMNLLYGWEYSGILIPALLALLWYEPTKILTSFVEAIAVVALASAVLRLPYLRDWTIEGARKTMVFFNVSFAYKLLLGHLLVWIKPEWQVTDFYGFGYMLPTLLAVKIHDKAIPLRLSVATISVAFLGGLLASIIGFGLTRLAPGGTVFLDARATALPPLAHSDDSLKERIRSNKIALYEKLTPDSFLAPNDTELETFRAALEHLRTFVLDDVESELTDARILLNGVNYEAEWLEDRYLLLTERAPQHGWGFYVLDKNRPDGLVLEIPAPVNEWNVLESGVALFDGLEGGALAVGGASRKAGPGQSSDLLRDRRTFFQMFHRVMSRRNVLQVRGHTSESQRVLLGQRTEPGSALLDSDAPSMLWVKRETPRSLQLGALESLAGPFQLEWRSPALPSAQRDETPAGFAELWLSRHDRKRLLYGSLSMSKTAVPAYNTQNIDGYLLESLMGEKANIARAGSNLYIVPSLAELVYLNEEVLVPMLELIDHEYSQGTFTTEGQATLQIIRRAAAVLGYEVVWYRHSASLQDYLVLKEAIDSAQRRYWGTYALRCGATAAPCLIQVPRPLYELNSFEFGTRFFERLPGTAIAISGAHRDANRDGSADVLVRRNQANLFNLFTQAWMRGAQESPSMVLQCRAFGWNPKLVATADVLFSGSEGTVDRVALPAGAERVLQSLEADRFRVRIVDGSEETAGYDGAGVFAARYRRQAPETDYGTLWLSPLVRSEVRQQDDTSGQTAQFSAVGIASTEVDVVELLNECAGCEPFGPVPPELREHLQTYLQEQNIVLLEALQTKWPGYRFDRWIDASSRHGFLAIQMGERRVPLIVNLSPRDPTSPGMTLPLPLRDHRQLLGFVSAGTPCLTLEPSP